MDKEQLLGEVETLEKERDAYIKSVEKQLIAYDGAIQALKALLKRYYNEPADNNTTETG